MPKTKGCYIGPLGAHTYNFERDECIWCGPNKLAWRKDGHWVPIEDGNAWSVEPASALPVVVGVDTDGGS